MEPGIDRDRQFPATSIGRTQGSRVQRDSSNDSLSAHPLLSTGRRPSSTLVPDRSPNSSPAPKYVPYTPRQRVSPTSATTGTTVHPSTSFSTSTSSSSPSSQHQLEDATTRLKLMNLKAEAQKMGLDSASLGWAMLEKLAQHENDLHDSQWTEIWTAVTSKKATLLLPLEPVSSVDKLTPELYKDHIALCDEQSQSRKQAPIVTLSGLRGTLQDDTLTLRSTIHPSSKIFQDILSPTTRPSALKSLPELPLISETHLDKYPKFILPSYSSGLPIPPPPPGKPALPPAPTAALPPPRPGNRAASSTSSATSRITNPFASLFGGSSGGAAASNNLHNHNNQHQNQNQTKSGTTPATPLPTGSSTDPTSSQTESVIDVSAFTIERKIIRKDVARAMNKAIRLEVTEALLSAFEYDDDDNDNDNDEGTNSSSLPSWVMERVHGFTADWYPFVKKNKKGKDLSSSSSTLSSKSSSSSTTTTTPLRREREREEEGGGNAYVVTMVEEASEKTAMRMQDFYFALEQDLRLLEGSFADRFKERRGGGGGGGSGGSGDKESGGNDEKRVKDKIDGETKIKEVMEAVERTICSLFYDRLYMQPTSDDSSHDETLSSRVAALNMLDLGLEHLDLKVDHPSEELDAVIRACGETLSQLQLCRSPGDKATLLVSAHKIVVDGLSRLPPIRLMTEEESKTQKTKGSSMAAGGKAEAPPREPDGTLRILMPLPHTASETTATDPLGISETSTSLVFEAPPGTGSDVGSSQHNRSDHLSPSIPTIVEPGSTSKSNSNPDWPSSSSKLTPVAPSSAAQPSSPNSPTPVSGDVLLPMIIFSVVKANPPHLVSNLLYTQRYRNQSVGGEESYCLINLLAVAEFLENVDLTALGLGDSDKVLSAADLTPIPLNRSPIAPNPSNAADGLPGSFRDRVEQANKVITGVVDSSFGMLRSLLPNTAPPAPITPTSDGVQGSAPWNVAKPGFGLLRRETGFSIKSITAALPINRGVAKVTSGEESGQQLVTVSRPESVKSNQGVQGDIEPSDVEESEVETGNDEEEGDEQMPEDPMNGDLGATEDVRSIKSFESMMRSKGERDRSGAGTRKSLTDRLARMSNLAGLKSSTHSSSDSPALPKPQLPDSDNPAFLLAPPIQRFVDCTPGDLRLSEVGELLRDYRRLVEAIRAVKGFDE